MIFTEEEWLAVHVRLNAIARSECKLKGLSRLFGAPMVTEISREVATDEFAVIFAQGGLDWRQSKRRIAKAIQARGHDAKRSKPVEATGEIYGDSGARLPVLEARSSHEAQSAPA